MRRSGFFSLTSSIASSSLAQLTCEGTDAVMISLRTISFFLTLVIAVLGQVQCHADDSVVGAEDSGTVSRGVVV